MSRNEHSTNEHSTNEHSFFDVWRRVIRLDSSRCDTWVVFNEKLSKASWSYELVVVRGL